MTKIRRKKNTVSQVRGFLYTLARLLGDLASVKKGKTGKRIARRAAGKGTGKALRSFFK